MKKERVRIIDSLRGFSLLGIFLINGVVLGYGITDSAINNDKIQNFLELIGENSFMPIFTFLFGYSLIKLEESLQRKNKEIKWHLVRRFSMLILMGIIHATIWNGDILFTYGIIGFLLLFLINKKTKTLMIFGISLFILSIITNSQTMPLFLFGMAAAKGNIFLHLEREYVWYKRGIILIPIALCLKYIGSIDFGNFWLTMLLNIGSLLLAIGYIAAFSLVFTQFSDFKIFKWFENVGKMSLTNYIMQTVIFVCGYHTGLFKGLDTISNVLLVMFIFSAQCWFSSVYLKKFHYGPFERLLRDWTNLSRSK